MVRLRLDEGGLGVGVLEVLALVLLNGDHARRQELLGPLELGASDLQPSLRDFQVCLGLLEPVPDIPGVDLGEQCARLHFVADVDVEAQDLARRFRFDLHLADRLDVARRLRGDHEVGPLDDGGLDRRGLFRFVRAARSEQGQHERGGTKSRNDSAGCHTRIPVGSFKKSLAILPS